MGGPALGSLSSYHVPNVLRLAFGGAGINHTILRDVGVASLSPNQFAVSEGRRGLDTAEFENDSGSRRMGRQSAA